MRLVWEGKWKGRERRDGGRREGRNDKHDTHSSVISFVTWLAVAFGVSRFILLYSKVKKEHKSKVKVGENRVSKQNECVSQYKII